MFLFLFWLSEIADILFSVVRASLLGWKMLLPEKSRKQLSHARPHSATNLKDCLTQNHIYLLLPLVERCKCKQFLQRR